MATIYCFTSTGNSLYAARKIAERIGANVLPVTYESVTTDDDVIGIVFPAFYWGAPKIVEAFVEKLRITNADAYVFAVISFGGAAPGAAGGIRKRLKGAPLSYTAMFKDVENYLPGYKTNETAEAHAKADEKTAGIIDDIAAGKRNNQGHYGLLNILLHRMFPGNKPDCDRSFVISDSCTGCGTCAKVCPVRNINIESGRPAFSHHCEHCIACMHVCPEAAIDCGKSKGRTRYVHPQIGTDGLISFWRSAENNG